MCASATCPLHRNLQPSPWPGCVLFPPLNGSLVSFTLSIATANWIAYSLHYYSFVGPIVTVYFAGDARAATSKLFQMKTLQHELPPAVDVTLDQLGPHQFTGPIGLQVASMAHR